MKHLCRNYRNISLHINLTTYRYPKVCHDLTHFCVLKIVLFFGFSSSPDPSTVSSFVFWVVGDIYARQTGRVWWNHVCPHKTARSVKLAQRWIFYAIRVLHESVFPYLINSWVQPSALLGNNTLSNC